MYYHAKNNTSLKRSIVNITTQAVERDEELHGLQGPIDWTEYAAMNDDPQANHYSIPLPLEPIFDSHTLELFHLEKLPLGTDPTLDNPTQRWEPAQEVE